MNDKCPQPTWYTKHGLAIDPRGFQVTMQWNGRTLLGDVTGVVYEDSPVPGFRLVVRHFNGDSWPIRPAPTSVVVLDRGRNTRKKKGA